LSIHISFFGNLQLFVGKSQLPVHNLFNRRRRWATLQNVIPRLHDQANIEQTSSKPDGTPPLTRLRPQLITCYIGLPITTRPPS